MNLVTRLGLPAAALVLTVSTSARAQEVDPLAQQIAAHSAATLQVLERLSAPQTAQRFVNAAIAGDPRTIDDILNGIELPVVNKCFWVSELVEKFTSSTGFVQQCWVREDLSTEEWFRYTQIAVRHDQIGRDAVEVTYEKDALGHVLIPRGPFLDELKADNLVTCEWVRKTTGRSSVLFGKPERFCVHTP
jgi:hypothetical protein